ncbi:hypothetical protein DAPPUDRAFT_232993 [Daphnia pulex]|uniref:Uncharacterized protein n=1 Tax=Daphnia pulex TaxID=6669 RepID=E9FSW8_DAPPU|nr:hypothetical protein DAPPUDRAFT_232993 [Daphnia pulex]|eukprot:EFX89745.1 hypothetical protein DAPPUDRAFT_232993 [Daphnia pulex]
MVSKYYTTKSPKCYTTTYAAPPAEPRITKSLEYYTTTYVARAYYTVAPKYYNTKVSVYYTTTCAASTCYTETSKHFSVSVTTPRLKLTTPSKRLKTTPKRLITTLPQATHPQLIYYTTTYASSYYYTEASKYCIEKLESKSRTASKTYGAPVYYTEEPNR